MMKRELKAEEEERNKKEKKKLLVFQEGRLQEGGGMSLQKMIIQHA